MQGSVEIGLTKAQRREMFQPLSRRTSRKYFRKKLRAALRLDLPAARDALALAVINADVLRSRVEDMEAYIARTRHEDGIHGNESE